eukprot:scaffold713_cov131-Cylindrotheca_fusiformis.AAC.30
MFARHDRLVQALAKISCFLESDFHEYACKIIANLTRHRGNTKHLLFNHPMVVQALTTASYSQNDESRKHSCYAIQNFAEDKACRHHLAVAKNVLPALCVRVKQAFDHEERLAAIHALKNLSQEPENLILMTNTADCIPTLMHIADASDDNVTETMQFTGCDALANLSQHFMQIAESGKSIDREKRGEAKASEEVFVPFLNNILAEAVESWNEKYEAVTTQTRSGSETRYLIAWASPLENKSIFLHFEHRHHAATCLHDIINGPRGPRKMTKSNSRNG